MNLLNSGSSKTNAVSVIKNLFDLKKVTGIHIMYSSWGDKFFWYATITFKNGNTEGKQRTPEVETFEQVIKEIQAIENSLK